jgi:hypothetical protein
MVGELPLVKSDKIRTYPFIGTSDDHLSFAVQPNYYATYPTVLDHSRRYAPRVLSPRYGVRRVVTWRKPARRWIRKRTIVHRAH